MSDKISSWNVVHRLEKRSLLVGINCIAALSILMFGYDQGLMSGVNNAKDYIDLMGFGYTHLVNGTLTPVVTNTLLQGGIVSVYYLGTLFGALFGGWVGDRIGRIRVDILPNPCITLSLTLHITDHRTGGALGDCRCYSANVSSKPQLDDLW